MNSKETKNEKKKQRKKETLGGGFVLRWGGAYVILRCDTTGLI